MYVPHPGSTVYSPSLDLDAAILLANALMSNRLDYCNSPLSGIAETDLSKLKMTSALFSAPDLQRSMSLFMRKYPMQCKVSLCNGESLYVAALYAIKWSQELNMASGIINNKCRVCLTP